MRITDTQEAANSGDFYATQEITRELLLKSHNRPGERLPSIFDDRATYWITFLDFDAPEDANPVIDVAHGNLRCYYYKRYKRFVPVYDNRPFPAREAPESEWYEYEAYGDTPEGRAHFKGYADPFNTPDEELRQYLWVQFSICEAYTLLKFAYPEITAAELLADLREADSKGQIMPGQLAAVLELSDFLKTSGQADTTLPRLS